MNGKLKYLVFGICAVLVVSTITAGIVSSARSEEDEIEILVYKDGMDPETLRMSREHSVIEEYEEFILVKTAEENKLALENEGYMVENLPKKDNVNLHSFSFDTSQGSPDISEDLKIEEYPSGQRGQYILQFIGPVKPEWKDQLKRKGVILHEYRHRYNFIVEMTPETREKVDDLEFVDWTGIYQPGYKFDHQLLEETAPMDLRINLFSDAHTAAIAKKVVSFGGELYHVKEDEITTNIRADLVEFLANSPGVKSITPANLDYQLFNHDATWVTQTNQTEERKVTEEGVTGTGQIVTVMDSELYMDNGGHEMWKDPDGDPIGDDHRKVQAHYVPSGSGGDLGEGQYHGSHVTGTVLGDAPPHDDYNNEDGHGMGARLIHQDIGQSGGGLSVPGDMYNDAWQDSYDRGSRIHTNSWGGGRGGGGSYTGEAVTSDEFIWDHKDYSILWAAGNDGSGSGTISPQGHSKNAITVGACGNAPIHDDMADFSSRGYASDGRIKPTILGVGLGVTSSDRSADGYSGMSGTSMATPGIAGQTAQVREYYKRGWYPTGSRDQEDGFNPSSALVKATLVNGAEEISGDGAYLNDDRFPNGDQGFGRSNLDRSLYFEWDERKLRTFDSSDEGVSLSTGESWSMEFDVEDTTMPLEATLVWSDYAGSDGADPAIVNDLDLEMSGPTGTRYVGNAFTGSNPGYSSPDPSSNPWNGGRSGEWDGLNVVENTLLLPDQNGVEAGTYNLSVNAHNVANGPQPFAVVISGGISPVMDEGDPPQINIDTPNGGEAWNEGTQQDITWTTTPGADPIDRIDLRYTIDGGETWDPLASNLSDSGTHTWTVPNHDSTECLVKARVLDQADRFSYDISDNTFEIVGSPPSSTSNLDVERGGGPTMVPIDDFEEGNHDNWTVNDGSWSVNNGYLEGNGVISRDAVLGNESVGAYGRWEWDFQFDTLKADGDTYQLMRFDFIQNSDDPTSPTGYYVLLSGETPGGTQANLWAIENGQPPDDSPLISGNWIADTGWHTLAVERDTNNDFALYVDGTLIGTAHDERFTNSQYLGLRHDANPLGSPHNVDEVRVQTTLENDEHNHVSWAASPQDPNEVSHYNIYRSDKKSGNYQKIGSVEANGSTSYKYVDEYKGKVDNTYWWYRSRAVGENGLEEDNKVEKQEPGAPGPLPPSDPQPTDGATGIGTGPELSVYMEHQTGKSMNVSFYDASDDSLIGTETNVQSGNRAKTDWTGLDSGKVYEWYAVAEDGEYNISSSVWDFTTGSQYELTISVEGQGTTDPPAGSNSYEEGTEVNVEATPAQGWYFKEWTGDFNGTAPSVNITMDQDKQVTAWFEEEDIVEYNLTINVEGEGSTEPAEGTYLYEEGTDVPVEATPAQGWKFVEWTGDYEGTEKNITITMDSEKNITAHFEEESVETYTLTINTDGQGTVTAEPDQQEYEEDTEVTLTATPDQDWNFVEWTGDYEGTSEEVTITMDGDKEITAVFEEETVEYDLTINVDGEGSTDPEEGTHTYSDGDEVTVTASPNDGWYFEEWTGDTTETGGDITVVMDEDKTITAHFTEVGDTENVLTIGVEGNGTTEPEPGDHTYEEGTNVTIEATPDQGWYFKEWTGDHEGTKDEITIKMDEDKEITASFAEIGDEENILTINIDGEGSTDPAEGTHTYGEGEEVAITATADEGWSFEEWTGTEETGEEITIKMDEDKEITAHFEESEPAYFEIEIASDNEDVQEGEEITVEYTVTNTGGLEGTQDIRLLLDGEEEDVYSSLTLAPGEEYEGNFTVDAEDVGELDFEVSSDDSGDEITVIVEEDESKGSASFLANYWWLLPILLIVIIAAIALALLMGGEDEEEEEPVPPPPPQETQYQPPPQEETFEQDRADMNDEPPEPQSQQPPQEETFEQSGGDMNEPPAREPDEEF